MGHNIFIVAELPWENQNKSLEWLKNNVADQYINALFGESYNRPVFSKTGKVFGTSTFEYSIYKNPDENNHVYV